jgi:hypothetical protein
MELPSVLRSLPSRSSTVTVSKALLRLGRLLVQLLGVAVDGKLTRLRSRSAFPCSHHPVGLVDHRPSPFWDWLSTLSQPPDHEQGDGCLQQHQRPWAGLRHAQLVGQLPDISYSPRRNGSSRQRCGMRGGPAADRRLDPAT